ncbi:MAG TPA: NAD-dependent epimerase/dehydratase family protein [Pseudomonadales bacterium]|nr:NAD-dependent epimerase/dehydratase family protein [Pseudomonadales bacterium]
MQTCLVTGAGGFLGRELVRQLSRETGFRIKLLVRGPWVGNETCECVTGSLSTQPDSYRHALQGVDTVFHLAAIAHTNADPDQYRLINCEATLALARQAEMSGVKRFVFVSSTKAAADPGALRRDESWSDWPADPYGYWKRRAEQQLLDGIAIPHLSIIRPCLMYGPGLKGNLYSMLHAIDKGYFPPVPETGAERSMVSVQDVAHALRMVAMHPEANRKVLIAADGEAYTAHKIYQAMRQALGKPPARWTLPMGLLKGMGHCGDLLQRLWPASPICTDTVERLMGPAAYSASALCNLGWGPACTFYEALPEIVGYYREHVG